MLICYIDESGTPDIPGNTSHYILAGVSIPVEKWKDCDRDIETLKTRVGLAHQEIHVAWMLRRYLEQTKISGFDALDYQQRRYQVNAFRTTELLRLQRAKNRPLYKQTRKNYQQTDAYVHLTYDERKNFTLNMARLVSGWGFARLFAECINKIYFDPNRAKQTIDEQAFEQVVSRFEQYLRSISPKAQAQDKTGDSTKNFGLLVHDNNQTVARKHTLLMKKFYRDGTLWTDLENIIETPLFVDSELTGMVQIADLCGYALRRYLENGEEELFDLLFKRADRKYDVVVGVRHFTEPSCVCKICRAHKKPAVI